MTIYKRRQISDLFCISPPLPAIALAGSRLMRLKDVKGGTDGRWLNDPDRDSSADDGHPVSRDDAVFGHPVV